VVKIESVAQNAPQVEQVYFEVDRRSKLEALTRLIDVHDFRYGIIFCSTKIMVDDLDEHLHARGYLTDRLHGDITQAQRDRVMDKFRRRGFEFLIATDVAARGLDVDDLEVVFNFDLPNDAEDYTHRIGRTGRAGKGPGLHLRFRPRDLQAAEHGPLGEARHPRERHAVARRGRGGAHQRVLREIRATLDGGQFKKQDRMIDRLLDQGYASTDIASALMRDQRRRRPRSPCLISLGIS
jgi:ATP-dependent RNA helicase DeaD